MVSASLVVPLVSISVATADISPQQYKNWELLKGIRIFSIGHVTTKFCLTVFTIFGLNFYVLVRGKSRLLAC